MRLRCLSASSMDLPILAATVQWAHFILSMAGKGWFPFFRFYGADDPLLRKTWKLPDIERMK